MISYKCGGHFLHQILMLLPKALAQLRTFDSPVATVRIDRRRQRETNHFVRQISVDAKRLHIMEGDVFLIRQ
jgi:hypothetical protein